ncbi:MAG: hypothetical protein JNM18_24710 [Planctomycetaceae bacterium]|nr:hypothetical protein [Planctomycetaceae bacterium]
MEPGGKSRSLDGKHEVELSYTGEIPFGPPYFTLRIDSHSFGERIFGYGALWSPDSSILVVTEWHTLERGSGPITSLLLIRPDDWTYSQFPKLTKGFAIANYFVDRSRVLRHTDEIYQGGSFKVERQTDLDTIDDWKPLPLAR